MVNLGQAFFFQGQSLEKVVKNAFILLISLWLAVFNTQTLIKCIKMGAFAKVVLWKSEGW